MLFLKSILAAKKKAVLIPSNPLMLQKGRGVEKC